MIPEVAVAMLACARIGAIHNVVFGGFSPASVKERMEFSDAKALITLDGARRKGKTAPIKQQVDELRHRRRDDVRRASNTGQDDVPMRRRRRLVPRGDGAPPTTSARPSTLDAETPLFILYTSGSTNKPKGVLHTTGGYLTGVAWTTKHVFDLKPDERRVLVLGRRRLDHRPLVHRLRPAAQRRDERHVGGRPGLPGQGHLVGD